jgi:hypothetical protein
MLAKIYSAAVYGVDAYEVEIEVNGARGEPKIIIVGLPDTAVKESQDRVTTRLVKAAIIGAAGDGQALPLSRRQIRPSFELSREERFPAFSGQLGHHLCFPQQRDSRRHPAILQTGALSAAQPSGSRANTRISSNSGCSQHKATAAPTTEKLRRARRLWNWQRPPDASHPDCRPDAIDRKSRDRQKTPVPLQSCFETAPERT